MLCTSLYEPGPNLNTKLVVILRSIGMSCIANHRTPGHGFRLALDAAAARPRRRPAQVVPLVLLRPEGDQRGDRLRELVVVEHVGLFRARGLWL